MVYQRYSDTDLGNNVQLEPTPYLAHITSTEQKINEIQQLKSAPNLDNGITVDQKIDEIHEQMTQILKFVENINNQVSPIMEQLKNHPLFSAFFGD